MPSHLDIFTALAYARAGSKIRRNLWADRYVEHQSGWFYLQLANAATHNLGERRIVLAADLTQADLEARDWTTNNLGDNEPEPPIIIGGGGGGGGEGSGGSGGGNDDTPVTPAVPNPIVKTWTGKAMLAATEYNEVIASATFQNPFNTRARVTITVTDGDGAETRIQVEGTNKWGYAPVLRWNTYNRPSWYTGNSVPNGIVGTITLENGASFTLLLKCNYTSGDIEYITSGKTNIYYAWATAKMVFESI